MRINVVHTYGFQEELRSSIESAIGGRRLEMLRDKTQFAESVDAIEALLAFRPPRNMWGGALRLRMIQTAGAGVDAVLPAPDLPTQVAIANARGVHSNQMAEHALLMMLIFAKQLPHAMKNQMDRQWRFYMTQTLVDRTCVVVGMGTIGREVAARAKQFKMNVIGIQRTPKSFDHADEVLPASELKATLRRADFAVVVLPLTEATRHLLNESCLEALPPGAVLVNMARGGIVDESALARLLLEGRLKGAALDVFADEPLPADSTLWSIPNLIITPHVAGVVPDYMERVLRIFADNLQRLEAGRPLVNQVDRQRGY